jgi:site-specific recombinase XerD
MLINISNHYVPMNNLQFAQDIREYIEDLDGDDYLFTMHSIASINSMIKRYAKNISLTKRVSIKILRNSFAIYSLQSGVGIKSVQKILGYKRLDAMTKYLDAIETNEIEDYRRHPLSY